jgi:hypothetical protein
LACWRLSDSVVSVPPPHICSLRLSSVGEVGAPVLACTRRAGGGAEENHRALCYDLLCVPRLVSPRRFRSGTAPRRPLASPDRSSSADARRSPARCSKGGRAERAPIPTAVAGSATNAVAGSTIDEVAIQIATGIREGWRRRAACHAGRAELRGRRPRSGGSGPQ